MSIVNSLQNGQKVALGSKANVTINTGDGHSNINVTGNNVNIDTGCGDQNITVNAAGNLKIDTGHCGEDNITAVVAGNANIITREDDDEVELVVGGNFDINVGKDEHDCGSFTDNDTVKVISTVAEGQNYIKTGKDDDIVTVIANNVDLDKGEGTLLLGALGSNYDIDSEAKENTVGFYGNNYDINFSASASKNDVRTLDFWLRDGEDGKKVSYVINPETGNASALDNQMALKDMVDDFKVSKDDAPMTLNQYDKQYNAENVEFFKDNFGDFFNNLTSQGQRVTVTEETVILDEQTVQSNTKEQLADKYNLSAEERKILNSIDMTAKYSDGKPLYAIVKSPRKGVYVIAKRDGVNHARAVSNNECIAFTSSAATTHTGTSTTTTKTETTVTTKIEDLFATTGVSNVTINQNDGPLNAFITANGTIENNININKGENCNNDQVNNISVITGYVDAITNINKEVSQDTKVVKDILGAIFATSSAWTSPLVLDTNKDGKVSAEAGKGVDINNDGKADGAATGGDKMLAMSDLNKNGKIDGAEVFGDQTVSPFTGKKINAANGFEALEQIAKEAEQYTDYKVISNGKVNVQELAKALASVGIDLGLISDNNTSNLEALNGIKDIDVDNYKEAIATGDVQHRQLGTYTAENGVEYKVNDVWFKS